MRSTEIVRAFWDDVWNAREPDAIDRFVSDDVVIEAGRLLVDVAIQPTDRGNRTVRTTAWVTRSRIGRLLVAAGAVGVFAITGAPRALADPLATCTSDVVDGVEVDYCVGNPNANIVTGVPGVNVDWELSLGIGLGS